MAIHNMRYLEKTIVELLLQVRDAEEKTQYPPELYEPRRDAYRAQVETMTTKKSRPALQGGDGGQ